MSRAEGPRTQPTRPAPNVRVRDATPQDARRVWEIYAPYIERSVITWEEEVPPVEDMVQRMASILGAGRPFLVAEVAEVAEASAGPEAGEVRGYAYVNTFRPRLGYRYTVENSIYIEEGFGGRGIGRALLAELIARCQSLGIREIIAGIGEPLDNPASVGLHQAFGFRDCSTVERCAVKFGRTLSLAFMQLSLAQPPLVPDPRAALLLPRDPPNPLARLCASDSSVLRAAFPLSAHELDGPADVADAHSIYAHYADRTLITSEDPAPDLAEMASRIASVQSAGYPFVVVRATRPPPVPAEAEGPLSAEGSARYAQLLASFGDRDSLVVGYAYVVQMRARAAYRVCVENSLYVRDGWQGTGVGSLLLGELLRRCAESPKDLREMVAVVDPANDASVRLHERFGFERRSVLRSVCVKRGVWMDLLYMQRPIKPAA